MQETINKQNETPTRIFTRPVKDDHPRDKKGDEVLQSEQTVCARQRHKVTHSMVNCVEQNTARAQSTSEAVGHQDQQAIYWRLLRAEQHHDHVVEVARVVL